MILRYYPSFRVITNLNTNGTSFTLDGKPYSGKYYEAYDGRVFSGISPDYGPSEELERIPSFSGAPGLNTLNVSDIQKTNMARQSGIAINRIPGKPNSYYPNPTEEDYKKGYLIRYFTKKENEKGFVIEISRDEYNSIVDGTADYNISIYQTVQILWKITGPLKNKRTSQYNMTAGIIDTNERLVESANKTFLGIKDFIGGDYIKFSRPTM
jgi:hypothetical protein